MRFRKIDWATGLTAVLIILGCGLYAGTDRFKASTTASKSSAKLAAPLARRVLDVHWGRERGELTFVPVSPGNPDEGPSGFFVTDKEEIYVLDTTNRRINVYANGDFVKELKLRTKYYPHDILIADGALYVLTDMTLEKMTLDGDLITSNESIRKDPVLFGNTGRIFKSSSGIVVSPFETTKGEEVVCFSADTIDIISCKGIEQLFKKYDVVDSTEEGVFIFNARRELSFADAKGEHALSLKIVLDAYVNGKMYPAFTLFRMANGTIYTMNPKKEGISFYARKVQ